MVTVSDFCLENYLKLMKIVGSIHVIVAEMESFVL